MRGGDGGLRSWGAGVGLWMRVLELGRGVGGRRARRRHYHYVGEFLDLGGRMMRDRGLGLDMLGVGESLWSLV